MYYYQPPPPQVPRKKSKCLVLLISLGVLSSAVVLCSIVGIVLTGGVFSNSRNDQPRSSISSRSVSHQSTATPNRSRINKTPVPTQTTVPESDHPTRTPQSTWTPQPTPVPITAAVHTAGNVRAVPSTESEIIGKLAVGTNIELLETIVLNEMRWFKADIEGQTGWVSEIVLNLDGVAIDELDVARQTTKMFEVMPPAGVWCNGNSDLNICVNSFRYPTQVGYQRVVSPVRVIAFGVHAYNRSLQDISINPNDFTVVLADGRTWTYAAETFTYWDSPLTHVTISPGDKASGGILFAVSDTPGIERIIWRDFFGEKIVIDLRDPPTEEN